MQSRYAAINKCVAELLAEEDPMNLAAGNPDLVGEYAGEAAEIVRRVLLTQESDSVITKSYVADVVSEVFRRQFEEDIGAEQANVIASQVTDLVAGDSSSS